MPALGCNMSYKCWSKLAQRLTFQFNEIKFIQGLCCFLWSMAEQSRFCCLCYPRVHSHVPVLLWCAGPGFSNDSRTSWSAYNRWWDRAYCSFFPWFYPDNGWHRQRISLAPDNSNRYIRHFLWLMLELGFIKSVWHFWVPVNNALCIFASS